MKVNNNQELICWIYLLEEKLNQRNKKRIMMINNKLEQLEQRKEKEIK